MLLIVILLLTATTKKILRCEDRGTDGDDKDGMDVYADDDDDDDDDGGEEEEGRCEGKSRLSPRAPHTGISTTTTTNVSAILPALT